MSDTRYTQSILKNLTHVTRKQVEHVQTVLRKPHVHKPAELFIVALSYELPEVSDELVDQAVRAEAVAKLLKLVREKIGIERVGLQDVEKARADLQSESGKMWLKALFEPLTSEPNGVPLSLPVDPIEHQSHSVPVSMGSTEQPLPFGSRTNGLGGVGTTVSASNISVPATALPSGHHQSSVVPQSYGTLSSSVTTNDHHPSPSSDVIANVFCPIHGQVCGRGTASTSGRNPVAMRGGIAFPDRGWKASLIPIVVVALLYMLQNWVFDGSAVDKPYP